jgi:NADPH:quinone reductase-like Zn-dependent oxidoreductase
MAAYHAEYGGGLASLALRDDATPHPGPGEVLVRVQACSLNYRELTILAGEYPLAVRPDVVPACDGAGDVVALGDGVTRVAVGDRVMASIFPRWLSGPFTLEVVDQLGGSLDGMLREYAVVSQDALVAVPGHLSYEQAACLPCAALTGWNAVTGGRGVRPGETVVTIGSGGVALSALQFAKTAGARVIATTGDPTGKGATLRALGADAVVARAPGWDDEVLGLTDGRGAELVVAVAGLGTPTLRCAALGGEIAFVGSLAADDPVDARALFAVGATVRPVAVGSRAQFEAMTRALEAHAIAPVVDRVFAFADAIEAYTYYEREQPLGKVVIAR